MSTVDPQPATNPPPAPLLLPSCVLDSTPGPLAGPQGALSAQSITRGDLRRLHCELRHATEVGDAAVANRHITRMHRRLGLHLRRAVGTQLPTFHDWAFWGSEKAGTIIRGERSLAHIAAVGGWLLILCGAAAWLPITLIAKLLTEAPTLAPLSVAENSFPHAVWYVGYGVLGIVVWSMTRFQHERARRQIADGNRRVLDDIGRVTISFLQQYYSHDAQYSMARFLSRLQKEAQNRPERRLLYHAFRLYWTASQTSDPRVRGRQLLLANCLAVIHEHMLLQPNLQAAVPQWARRFVTRLLLGFKIGNLDLRIALRNCDVETLEGWRRDSSLGSANGDFHRELSDYVFEATSIRFKFEANPPRVKRWTNFRQRIPFLVYLFATLHECPQVIPPGRRS